MTAFSASRAEPRQPPVLGATYRRVREASIGLASHLSPEDQQVQPMPDASPTKWHLAHTTWFFEAVVLMPHCGDYEVFDPSYHYLFNSYYEALGPRHPRPERGMITRPSADEVRAYRRHVDAAMESFLADEESLPDEVRDLVELGFHHEQQHQALILTDILYAFSLNPLLPAYRRTVPARRAGRASGMEWIGFEGGIYKVGNRGRGFAFDNERPRHEVLLRPFRLSNRLVTNGEFRSFVEDGGYRRPELWLSDGWTTARNDGWEHPLYWRRSGGGWSVFGLAGLLPMEEAEPVSQLSYYEADAYARWVGARLPTEAEWEVAAAGETPVGNTAATGQLRPVAADPSGGGRLLQMFGDVWEWTSSSYGPYPGYRPPPGAVGEYNGKFMCNQMVLRGGSCVTPDGHVRATYRNFFYPHQRWQFSGLRLAEDG